MGDEERKQRLIQWLCTPKRERDPTTQEELARILRCRSAKLSEWKRDPEFIRLWEAHYMRTIGSPERKQALLDTLFRTGSDADDPRHVQAAAKYLELVEGLRPQQLEVTIKRPLADLTDDEIDAIVQTHAEKERKLRLVENE